MRVNVQLIKASTDAHLWADTYDRKLTDIFAVETEIAQTIADKLQAKLTGLRKPRSRKSPHRIRKPTSSISKAAFSGTSARRLICGNRSTTSTRRSRKTRLRSGLRDAGPGLDPDAALRRRFSEGLQSARRGRDSKSAGFGRNLFGSARGSGVLSCKFPVQFLGREGGIRASAAVEPE